MTHPTPLSTAAPEQDLVARLREACKGHPHAEIAWPHYILHEAANEIELLRERNSEHEHRYDALEARLGLRQPVAGDVVERVNDEERTRLLFLSQRLRSGYHDPQTLYDAADAIERLRQPVAVDASDLVKALEEEAEWLREEAVDHEKLFKEAAENGDFLFVSQSTAMARVFRRRLFNIEAALTRHRQGEK